MAESQPTFEYSEKQLEWLLHCTSAERMKPYYVRARGDPWVAFHLYVRNTEISAALYGVVQALEVSLRNVIHNRLREDLSSQEWWSSLPLHDRELSDIDDAKKKIADRLQTPTPSQIVAELNFGFWVALFANSYEKQIWVPHTSRVFPGKLSRKTLHERLIWLRDLRNRIAHHETLIRRNPAKDYEDLLETIGWISPTVRKWVEHHSSFPEVYSRRIPKRPKASPTEPSAGDIPSATNESHRSLGQSPATPGDN
jgi:hypothetical protein